jgi:hypothetical protein
VEDGEEIPADLEERLRAIEFSIAVAQSTISEDTVFDADEGVVLSSNQRVRLKLGMTFRSPDEDSADVTGFDINLAIAQTAAFNLLR